MSFKGMIERDLHAVFLDTKLLADKRTVRFDGATYTDVSVVMTGIREQSRRQLADDNAQGLYRAATFLYCAESDLGGRQPEKGQRIYINDREGGGGFFMGFYVAESVCEMGMLELELEEIEE